MVILQHFYKKIKNQKNYMLQLKLAQFTHNAVSKLYNMKLKTKE